MSIAPPSNQEELLCRANRLAGCTLQEIATLVSKSLPSSLKQNKGAVGQLIEEALGATSRSKPAPDFEHLGIELKTIPVDYLGKPKESTHICMVALNRQRTELWENSLVRKKLKRVLWIPVLSAPNLPLRRRTVGSPTIWTPSRRQEAAIRTDWEEHMELIITGQINQLDSRMGTVLQIRPKALNAKQLTASHNDEGLKVTTLPRGFYLRSSFTRQLLAE